MNVLGLIPARGGSKGVPDKNRRLLGGRSLIELAALAARDSGVVTRVVLSTESQELAELGRAAGVDVPFLRPAELASDDAPMLPVVQHALHELEAAGDVFDYVVLLQPTSPLRRGEHVRTAIGMLDETGCDSIVSVVALPLHLSPDRLLRIEDGRLVRFSSEGPEPTRRQDARLAYVRDGTVYAWRTRVVLEENSLYGGDSRPLVIDPTDSVTIDTASDWEEAERRLGLANRATAE